MAMNKYPIDGNVLAPLFKRFPELNIQQIAIGMGINPALMRQYVGGKKHPSIDRIIDIENYLHELGAELQKIKL